MPHSCECPAASAHAPAPHDEEMQQAQLDQHNMGVLDLLTDLQQFELQLGMYRQRAQKLAADRLLIQQQLQQDYPAFPAAQQRQQGDSTAPSDCKLQQGLAKELAEGAAAFERMRQAAQRPQPLQEQPVASAAPIDIMQWLEQPAALLANNSSSSSGPLRHGAAVDRLMRMAPPQHSMVSTGLRSSAGCAAAPCDAASVPAACADTMPQRRFSVEETAALQSRQQQPNTMLSARPQKQPPTTEDPAPSAAIAAQTPAPKAGQAAQPGHPAAAPPLHNTPAPKRPMLAQSSLKLLAAAAADAAADCAESVRLKPMKARSGVVAAVALGQQQRQRQPGELQQSPLQSLQALLVAGVAPSDLAAAEAVLQAAAEELDMQAAVDEAAPALDSLTVQHLVQLFCPGVALLQQLEPHDVVEGTAGNLHIRDDSSTAPGARYPGVGFSHGFQLLWLSGLRAALAPVEPAHIRAHLLHAANASVGQPSSDNPAAGLRGWFLAAHALLLQQLEAPVLTQTRSGLPQPGQQLVRAVRERVYLADLLLAALKLMTDPVAPEPTQQQQCGQHRGQQQAVREALNEPQQAQKLPQQNRNQQQQNRNQQQPHDTHLQLLAHQPLPQDQRAAATAGLLVGAKELAAAALAQRSKGDQPQQKAPLLADGVTMQCLVGMLLPETQALLALDSSCLGCMAAVELQQVGPDKWADTTAARLQQEQLWSVEGLQCACQPIQPKQVAQQLTLAAAAAAAEGSGLQGWFVAAHSIWKQQLSAEYRLRCSTPKEPTRDVVAGRLMKMVLSRVYWAELLMLVFSYLHSGQLLPHHLEATRAAAVAAGAPEAAAPQPQAKAPPPPPAAAAALRAAPASQAVEQAEKAPAVVAAQHQANPSPLPPLPTSPYPSPAPAAAAALLSAASPKVLAVQHQADKSPLPPLPDSPYTSPAPTGSAAEAVVHACSEQLAAQQAEEPAEDKKAQSQLDDALQQGPVQAAAPATGQSPPTPPPPPPPSAAPAATAAEAPSVAGTAAQEAAAPGVPTHQRQPLQEIVVPSTTPFAQVALKACCAKAVQLIAAQDRSLAPGTVRVEVADGIHAFYPKAADAAQVQSVVRDCCPQVDQLLQVDVDRVVAETLNMPVAVDEPPLYELPNEPPGLLEPADWPAAAPEAQLLCRSGLRAACSLLPLPAARTQLLEEIDKAAGYSVGTSSSCKVSAGSETAGRATADSSRASDDAAAVPDSGFAVCDGTACVRSSGPAADAAAQASRASGDTVPSNKMLPGCRPQGSTTPGFGTGLQGFFCAAHRLFVQEWRTDAAVLPGFCAPGGTEVALFARVSGMVRFAKVLIAVHNLLLRGRLQPQEQERQGVGQPQEQPGQWVGQQPEQLYRTASASSSHSKGGDSDMSMSDDDCDSIGSNGDDSEEQEWVETEHALLQWRLAGLALE